MIEKLLFNGKISLLESIFIDTTFAGGVNVSASTALTPTYA